MLTLSGYNVELSKNGQEATEKYIQARDMNKPFDAVIMDLTIPGGMGGSEAITALLKIDPDARVIVSSGYSTDPIMQNYKHYGFKAMINKPYTVGELEKTLNGVLQKK
jgi:two-component system, cell cycle sensor histidine kinase and response regulator CckA